MSLDIWFREDIKNIMLAAEQANLQALQSGLWSTDPELQRACPECKRRIYHQGFRAALSTLALAFGLAPLPLQDADDPEPPTLEARRPYFITREGRGYER